MKKFQSGKMVIKFLLFWVIGLIFIWVGLVWHENRIVLFDMAAHTLADADEYEFRVEHVSYKKDELIITDDFIKIIGWIIKPEKTIDTVCINVILKNTTTNESYRVPTTLFKRSDISEVFFDEYYQYDYEESGFTVKIPNSGMVDTDKYDYEIFVSYNLNGEECLISLGTTIKTWEEQFHKKINENDYIVDTEGEYLHCIDRIRYKYKSDDKFEISGWFIKKGVSSENGTFSLVLKNTKTEECFKLPTTIVDRVDMTDYIGDGTDYLKSGFSVSIFQDDVIDMDKNNYDILMLYEENDIEYLIPLNTSVKEWGDDRDEE